MENSTKTAEAMAKSYPALMAALKDLPNSPKERTSAVRVRFWNPLKEASEDEIIFIPYFTEAISPRYSSEAKVAKQARELQHLARKFHGNWEWQGPSFKQLVAKANDQLDTANLYHKNFHTLAESTKGDSQEIFDAFIERMIEPDLVKPGVSLLQFFISSLQRILLERSPRYWKYASAQHFADAYFSMIAKTVSGVEGEYRAIRNLRNTLAGSGLRVEYASNIFETKDVDAFIKDSKDRIVYAVSVKCGRAFSRDTCIEKYRKQWSKIVPDMYLDEYCNYIVVNKKTHEPIKWKIESGPNQREILELWNLPTSRGVKKES